MRSFRRCNHLARAGLMLMVLLVGLPVAGVGSQRLHAEDTATPTAETGDAEASGLTRRDALIASVTIFVLAVFVGFEVITKVPPTLHTPLMSGSNAISGITIVGALLAAGAVLDGDSPMLPGLGTLAVVMATINVVGGFLVTHRMLSMFRRK